MVEDEPIIAVVQSETLKRFGYNVISVLSGEKALQIASGDQKIDLVLMDIDLGRGINGTETARLILEKKNIPIVFLTSHSEREMVEKVRGITRYGYVIKNSGDFVLQSSIEMAFELFEAHEKTSDSEARQRTLVQTIPDLIWLKNPDGVYLSCNHMFELFFGATEEQIVGKTDYDFVDRELADSFRKHDRRAMMAGKPTTNEEEITFASDGHKAQLETIKTPMIGNDGRVIGILGIARDITARKLAEEKLNTALQQMIDIIEFLPDPTFVIDHEQRVFAWNKAMEELSGVKKEDMIGKGDYAYSHPFYREKRPILIDLVFLPSDELEAKYDYVKHVGNTIYAEIYIPHMNRNTGAYLWGDAAPLFDPSGNRIGAIEVIRDITERKRTEQQLLKLNRIYNVLSNINHVILRIRETKKLLNEACRIAVEYGKFRMAWIGIVNPLKNKVDIVASSGDTEDYSDYIEKLNIDLNDEKRSSGPAGMSIKTGLHKISNNILNDDNMLPWRDDAVKFNYKSIAAFPLTVFDRVVGTFLMYSQETDFFDEDDISLLDEMAKDISFAMEFIESEAERKRAKEVLLESNEKYRTFFETSRDCVFITTRDGHWIDFNDLALEFFGYQSREELMKVSIPDLYYNPEDRDKHLRLIEESGFVKDYAVNLRRKDGSLIKALITTIPVKGINRNTAIYQGTIRDAGR